MKIIYTENDTEKVIEMIDGQWVGEDQELIANINTDPSTVTGDAEYYPTRWHEAKAIADALGGKLTEAPKPDFPTGETEGVVY